MTPASLISYILWVGGTWLFLLTFILAWRALLSYHWLVQASERSQHPARGAGEPYFVLLVPVLREQTIIEDAIEHFAKFTYPYQKFRVVFVTTAREEAERCRDLHGLAEIIRLRKRGVTPSRIVEQYPGLGPPSLVVDILAGTAVDDQERLQERLEGLPLTAQVIDRCARVANQRLGEPVFRRIHYPYPHGRMAHQVNHGVRYLFEVADQPVDPDRFYVGVYNADSMPAIDTLAVLSELIGSQPETKPAYQQHSLYRCDATLTGPAGSMIMHAAALWQDRWSLSIELPRSLRAEQLLERFATGGRSSWDQLRLAVRLPFNYAIGHGLFVRLRELVVHNYLPETTPNEDAPFGFIMLLAGIPLRPVPRVDVADVPRTVRGLLAQQGGWYLGPLYAFAYLRLARRNGYTRRAGRLLPCVLTLRLLWDAVAWVAGPVFMLFALAGLLIAPNWCTTYASLALAAYFIVPTIAAGLTSAKLASMGRMTPSLWRGIVGMPVFYVIHGLGAVCSAIMLLVRASLNLPVPKYKTER